MRRVVFFVMAVGLVVATGVIGGCSGGGDGSDSEQSIAAAADTPAVVGTGRSLTVFVDTDESGAIRAIFPDGVETTTTEEYEVAITQLVGQTDSETEIELQLGDNLAEQLDVDLDIEPDVESNDGSPIPTVSPRWDQRIPGTWYTLSGDVKVKHVAGCISRVTNRATLRLNKGSSQVFDIHMAAWKESGKSCYGIYESVVKKVNICVCSRNLKPPTLEQVSDAIYKTSIAVGITALTAKTITAVGAVIGYAYFIPLLVPVQDLLNNKLINANMTI